MIHTEDVQLKRQGIFLISTLFSQCIFDYQHKAHPLAKLRPKVKLVPDVFPVLIKHIQAEDAVTSTNACDCLCILGEDGTFVIINVLTK